MNLGKEIEHGGYPTSETRTISQMRRDADAYAGIGLRGGRRGGKVVESHKVVDTKGGERSKIGSAS